MSLPEEKKKKKKKKTKRKKKKKKKKKIVSLHVFFSFSSCHSSQLLGSK